MSLLLAVLATGLSRPAQDSEVRTFAVLGQSVPVVVPQSGRPVATRLESQGATYRTENGAIGPRDPLGWDWSTFRPVAPLPDAEPYRIKLMVFTRCEILEKRIDGAWRMRRATLERSQLEELWRAAALFGTMAETAAGGRIRVEFDTTVDADPERAVVEGPGPVFGADFLRRVVAPRINGSRFDADDKVDRGPYHGVFAVHCAMTALGESVVVRGTPISPLSFTTEPEAGTPGGLARAMYRRFSEQVALRGSLAGYGPLSGNADPLGWTSAAFWRAVRQFGPVATEDWVARSRGVAGEPVDLWTGPVARAEGLTGDRTAPAQFDAVLNPERESLAKSGDLVAVRSDAVGLVLANWPGGRKPTLLGRAMLAGAPVAIYQDPSFPTTGTESQILGLNLPQPSNLASLKESPEAAGLFAVAKTVGPTEGAAFDVTERGLVREGWATLYRSSAGVLADLSKTPVLRFKVRSNDRETFALQAIDDEGRIAAQATLGRPTPYPIEFQPIRVPVRVLPQPTATWTEVAVDLAALAGESSRLVELRIAPPYGSQFLERSTSEQTGVSIADVRFDSERAGLTEDAATEHPQDLPDEVVALKAMGESLSAAEQAQVAADLKSTNPMVRLNAVGLLTRAQAPAAVPALIDQGKSATPLIAELASRALAYQDTPEAWAALRWQVEIGPFDHNRESAAAQYVKRGDPSAAGFLSTMMSARSWHARLAGVEAIGALKSREATIILMAFMQELEPVIRQRVADLSDPALELANRRLLYVSVNDAHEAVREAALWTLSRSRIAEFRTEGMKGVRDESPYVRLGLLERMTKAPLPEHREALRIAVVDALPVVRAAAVDAFAASAEVVKPEEVENTFVDADPRVQAALLRLAEAKPGSVPSEVVAKLRANGGK